METKSANRYTGTEPEEKKNAEYILSVLGISISSEITMFYKQIILNKGLPLPGKISTASPSLNATALSEDEPSAEPERGRDAERQP